MRVVGSLLALFGAGGLVTGVIRLVHAEHVEPIGMALLVLMTVGGVLLFRLGSTRARSGAERGPELAVLRVAERHRGRVTAVLVAAEANVPIAVAERELAALAESGVCMRRTDEAGAASFFFPELESEDVKRKLFFADGEAKRAQKEGS
jgi:hypothetical protein